MEATTTKATLSSSFLLLLLLLLITTTTFAKPYEYQILILVPLPSPPTAENPHDLVWSRTEAETTLKPDPNPHPPSLARSTFTLPLHNLDSLNFNQTSDSLFYHRLTRDAVRVQTINTLTSTAQHDSINITQEQRIAARARTDFSSSIISGLSQGSGEYFTRLGVGTPPKYAYMVLDTGSDIVWLQCAPCRKCYSQSDPIFDPRKSKTFSSQPCGSPLCRKLDVSGCNSRRTCLYQVAYGDGSFTVGEFATETLTFRGTKVPNVAFGCGHDNEGLFVGAAGLLGLGRGKLSFPSQSGGRFGQKFSYCLQDRLNSGSKASAIVFGESAVSRNAVFTPMIPNPKLDTFYYLELLGFSVGGQRVAKIASSFFKLDAMGNGGVIIDSGTSVTRLTRPAYEPLRDAFRAGSVHLKRAAGFSLFDTCYDLSGKTQVKVPTVVMHFGRGADVSLPASNYLIPVSTNGIFCFAFAGTASGLSIIGNIQQQGIRVVFDNAGSRIGFAPRGCA